MQKHIFFIFLLLSTLLFSQQKIVRSLESNATYIEIHTKGIDDLKIEESASDQIEMMILNNKDFGVFENFTCTESNCVLKIETQALQKERINDKGNQLPIKPATQVNALIRIPKNKKVTILGGLIDVQSSGYHGQLRVLIEQGNVVLKRVLGVTQIELSSGSCAVTIDDGSLDIRTRKGELRWNSILQQNRSIRKKKNEEKLLIVRTVNANIILTSLSK